MDSQRLVPALGPILTGAYRNFELTIFPAPGGVTWPEWFHSRPTPELDFMCGLVYATYLLELAAPALIMYRKGEHKLLSSLLWAFFGANFLGAFINVVWPVAPPWYILTNGLGEAIPHAAPSAAGAARFDSMLGIQFFAAFYERNPYVFGALPSLHVATPFLVVWFTWGWGWKWRAGASLFLAWVTLAAIYLAHHYVLDVLAGYGVSALASLWGTWMVNRFMPRERLGLPPPVAELPCLEEGTST